MTSQQPPTRTSHGAGELDHVGPAMLSGGRPANGHRQPAHWPRGVADIVGLLALWATVLATSAAGGAAGATTYYISPNGSDTSDGTSPGAPIHSLRRASHLGLEPGDRVLLRRGGTFSGRLAIWTSGTKRAPITISAYGHGVRPVVTGECLELRGSHLTVTGLTVQSCATNGIWTDGTGNVITRVEALDNVQGINVGRQAENTKVVRNYLHDNDRLAPDTTGPSDDWGAVGIVVQGRNTEVAHNRITDNWAVSADFGTDGSAVEIYGGIGTSVHHNNARDNRTFTELGNSRSADNSFFHNHVRSALENSEFLITRGDSDAFGPVRGTVAADNRVRLTGSSSLGFSCYASCTAGYFKLVRNVLDVAGRIGYLEGEMSGGHNLYCRGSMDGLRLMKGDRYERVATSRAPRDSAYFRPASHRGCRR